MDRAWEAGGRGGVTSLETPLTQRERSSPGGGAQARGAGKAVHAPHKRRAARPPALVPPSLTQNRALAPRPGAGLLDPRFRNPASLWSPVCRENTCSAGRAARIGSPGSHCAPHRCDEPAGPLHRGLSAARGLGPELASRAAMWSLTSLNVSCPPHRLPRSAPGVNPNEPPCTPGGSEPRPSHAAGDGCRIPGPAGCHTVLRPPVPFSGVRLCGVPREG